MAAAVHALADTIHCLFRIERANEQKPDQKAILSGGLDAIDIFVGRQDGFDQKAGPVADQRVDQSFRSVGSLTIDVGRKGLAPVFDDSECYFIGIDEDRIT